MARLEAAPLQSNTQPRSRHLPINSDSRSLRLVPAVFCHEPLDRCDDRFGLVALGGVAAICERENFYRASGLAFDGFYLRHGAVLVVFALNGEDGAGDAGEIFFDVPAAEVGMEPDVVPSPECAGGVAMMAREFLCEIRFLESQLRFVDAGDAEVFDENVWGEQDESADVVESARVNQGDGTAVAVPEQDWIFNLHLLKEIGEGVEGFVVHVGDWTRLFKEIGVAGTVAGVDGDGASGGLGDVFGKMFPVRDGAESFVKKYELRRVGGAAGDTGDFERVPVDGEVEGFAMSHLV